jgi:flagellar hook protein FlgE
MTAVTGVRAHQVMLDVTGNNIANINTTGFKKDFTIFQDILYQTSQGATGPGDTRGGINPAQVGLGVKVAAIETIHSQGSAQYTGNKSDMMISGEGYYVLRNGGTRIYSRAGNFTLDADKALVHSGTGYTLQGYEMVRDPNNATEYIKAGDISDIVIPIGKEMEARATSVVGIKNNLDATKDPYLPIGYADIAYNDTIGDAKVKINDIEYNVSFDSKSPVVPAAGTPLAIEDYLVITLDSGNGTTAGTVNLRMTGIENGLPVLELPPVASPDVPEVTLNGTNPAEQANVAYKDGILKLTAKDTGATLWEINLQENMSYKSFTVTDNSAASPVEYDFIAEFDEGNLDKSPTTLTLWYSTGTGATLGKLTAAVSFKVNGEFDSVVWDDGQTFPGSLDADNFKIVPSTSNASMLEVQVAKDLVAPSVFDTVSQITQGGFEQTKLTVYDCQGNPYTMEVTFKKLTKDRWRWEASFPENPELFDVPPSGELQFGSCGKLVDPIDGVDIYVPFSLLGTQNETIHLDFSNKYFKGDDYEWDTDALEGLTQYASSSTVKAYYQDGYEMGVMSDYSVSKDGTIVGQYTNGQNQPIYRIALAKFANPMGLEKIGDTMFGESINSGIAEIDAAMDNGLGTIESGYLEMSNVDLTEEFTRLIIAQRGFQANTRVVTTSDQILEEVVNLKR